MDLLLQESHAQGILKGVLGYSSRASLGQLNWLEQLASHSSCAARSAGVLFVWSALSVGEEHDSSRCCLRVVGSGEEVREKESDICDIRVEVFMKASSDRIESRVI